MNSFDVIVIGGGPAGGYAALTAATNGCKVALFEEHGTIGWPRHDPGWLMESDFAESLIKAVDGAVPWARVKKYRVCQAESGEVIEESAVGGYQVRRDLLEKEIAAQAASAGAVIYLKTRVTGLLRNAGKVEAVETNSDGMPRADCGVIICADGIRSAGGGFAVTEGLCRAREPHPGVSYLLANADVHGGVIEHFLSTDPLLNNRTFFAHRDGQTYFSGSSDASLQELKERLDNVVSRKIKNAYPVEASGFGRAQTGKYGKYFEKIVKDNILFVGDASGGAGNIHGMIQGKIAGTVAAAAIKEADAGERRLSEYQDSVFKTLGKVPFCWFSAREDFGSFDKWFREFAEITRGIRATELIQTR